MKQTLSDKLESLECRRDDKARRVLNVAPDTIADITADELENGVTLERLEALNVPVLRYTGQLTIHGKLPSFNENARPGGYKAIFQNQNGSIGVRYAAIDAAKKETLARSARVVEKGSEAGHWFTSKCSTGFEVIRYFIVKDETQRETKKVETIAALKTFPVARFFGSIGAFSLAYGVGYAIVANIGAIPENEVWSFCSEIFGVANETELLAREAVLKAEIDAKHAQWKAESAVREKENAEKCQALIATLSPISKVPENGTIYVNGKYGLLKVQLTREKGRNYYHILERDGAKSFGDMRKLCKDGFPWPKALAANRVYVDKETLADMAKQETEKVTSVATIAGKENPYTSKDENAPASSRQTWALYCGTGKDWRNIPSLTYEKASQAIGAIQHLRGRKSEALAVVQGILTS